MSWGSIWHLGNLRNLDLLDLKDVKCRKPEWPEWRKSMICLTTCKGLRHLHCLLEVHPFLCLQTNWRVKRVYTISEAGTESHPVNIHKGAWNAKSSIALPIAAIAVWGFHNSSRLGPGPAPFPHPNMVRVCAKISNLRVHVTPESAHDTC